MPRNYDKYFYAELAIPRNSAWYPLLVAEAEAKGLPLAQVALERLAATYFIPGHPANSPSGALTNTRPLAPLQSPVVGPATAELEDDEDLELNEERAANNAAAFLENNGGFF